MNYMCGKTIVDYIVSYNKTRLVQESYISESPEPKCRRLNLTGDNGAGNDRSITLGLVCQITPRIFRWCAFIFPNCWKLAL